MENTNFNGYDIILQAGQSNSEGCGLGEANVPYITSEKVLYMTSDLNISTANERGEGQNKTSDFSLYFARKYLNSNMLKTNRKLLILRAAVGGTGFLDNRWGKNDDLFLTMLKMISHAKTLDGNNQFVAFLWHQGETDAVLKGNFENHYNSLSYLVDAVREETGIKTIPFAAGDFVQDWKNENIEICEPIIRAIKQVCKDKGGKFISTEGLTSNRQELGNDDSIHFSTKGLEELGSRYFDAIF